jgi:hypothetical protein
MFNAIKFSGGTNPPVGSVQVNVDSFDKLDEQTRGLICNLQANAKHLPEGMKPVELQEKDGKLVINNLTSCQQAWVRKYEGITFSGRKSWVA